MRQKLMEKYLSCCYRNQLFDLLLNHRQTSMVSKYIEIFDDLMLRTWIEDLLHTIRRFINGLREDIKVVELYAPDSLQKAYQKAITIKRYLKTPFVCSPLI